MENWNLLYSSKKLEEQVKFNIASACEGYLNGCRDCDYPSMSKQEWVEYIYSVMQDTFETEWGCKVGKDAAKHLHFYGKKKTMSLIEYYLENYEDVQKYID